MQSDAADRAVFLARRAPPHRARLGGIDGTVCRGARRARHLGRSRERGNLARPDVRTLREDADQYVAFLARRRRTGTPASGSDRQSRLIAAVVRSGVDDQSWLVVATASQRARRGRTSARSLAPV